MVFDKLAASTLVQPGKPVEQTFGPGAVYEYSFQLKAGEYCKGRVEPKDGGVNGAFYGPDGAQLYNLNGAAAQSRDFGIEAPVDGIYRSTLRSPAKSAKSVTVKVEAVEAGNRDAVAAFCAPSKRKEYLSSKDPIQAALTTWRPSSGAETPRPATFSSSGSPTP